MRTGATSVASEPMKQSSSITVRFLFGAVVVAGDGAGADVDVGADLGVADIGEVVGLRALADAARLDLDEVADVHLVGEARAGPQPRVRAEQAARADLGVVEVREGAHLGAGRDGHVAQHAVGADAHAVAQRDPALEYAVHVDRHVAPAFERAAHVDARRVGERHPGLEQARRLAMLHDALEAGQLLLRVDPGDLPAVVDLDREHRHVVGARQGRRCR